MYQKTYSGMIKPVPQQRIWHDMPDISLATLLPPLLRRAPGRPKKKSRPKRRDLLQLRQEGQQLSNALFFSLMGTTKGLVKELQLRQQKGVMHLVGRLEYKLHIYYY